MEPEELRNGLGSKISGSTFVACSYCGMNVEEYENYEEFIRYHGPGLCLSKHARVTKLNPEPLQKMVAGRVVDGNGREYPFKNPKNIPLKVGQGAGITCYDTQITRERIAIIQEADNQ